MHEANDLFRGGKFRLFEGETSVEEFLAACSVGTLVAFRQGSKVALDKVKDRFVSAARDLGLTLAWQAPEERTRRVKVTVPNLRNDKDGRGPNITRVVHEWVQYVLIRAAVGPNWSRVQTAIAGTVQPPEVVVIDPQSGQVLAGQIEPEHAAPLRAAVG